MAPEMVIWLFTAPSVTPGASSTVARMSRPEGSSRMVSTSKFADTSVVSTTATEFAVTVMSSDIDATNSDASARLVCASVTVTRLLVRCIPSSSNETVYGPGGIEGKW